MDIFNRKRIKELEHEFAKICAKAESLESENVILRLKLKELGELKDSTPEDCVRGPWCESCEFVKAFNYSKRYGDGSYDRRVAYACGKGTSCKNFIQKKENRK